MRYLQGLDARLSLDGLHHWLPDIVQRCHEQVQPSQHGKLPRWQQLLAQLPETTADWSAEQGVVHIGSAAGLDRKSQQQLQHTLQALRPWRKGPFSLFGIDIDAEWRSEVKWRRLQSAAVNFTGARVLDVGCGNGYYLWRMLADGAERVLGLEPNLVHVVQFALCQHFLQDQRADILPLPMEALPAGCGNFDVVCSMGVLYHRRRPLDFIAALIRELAPGGRMILESLVIPGDAQQLLAPRERYARMRNVWFIPSAQLLMHWLQSLGLDDVQLIDETLTTTQEQRSTEWMPYESLAEALHPQDPLRTLEGYPAPQRALLVARRSP